jgi:hypothetical protein
VLRAVTVTVTITITPSVTVTVLRELLRCVHVRIRLRSQLALHVVYCVLRSTQHWRWVLIF